MPAPSTCRRTAKRLHGSSSLLLLEPKPQVGEHERAERSSGAGAGQPLVAASQETSAPEMHRAKRKPHVGLLPANVVIRSGQKPGVAAALPTAPSRDRNASSSCASWQEKSAESGRCMGSPWPDVDVQLSSQHWNMSSCPRAARERGCLVGKALLLSVEWHRLAFDWFQLLSRQNTS